MIEYAGPRTERIRPGSAEGLDLRAFARGLDWVLLSAVVALVAYGLWAIEGVTRHDVPGDPRYYVLRQAVAAAVGTLGFVGALLIDPDLFRRFKGQVYAGAIGLVAAVYLLGAVARGSKRWIDVGVFRFQPSEFGKLFLVLALAAFLADRGKRVAELETVLIVLALGIGPMALVWVQPDIGTSLVYGAALAGVLFVAGARWLHLGVLAALGVVTALAVLWLLPASGVQFLQKYQQDRLTGFTHPASDPRGSTYNVNQSITAVGAGGLDGRGIAGATQTNLNYLPEHATDFAFASLSEQRGFVGVSVLLLLYLLVVWRGLKVVAGARDAFSAIAAGGIVVAFLFQVFVNVGMTIGIAPVTGIPLPFVSVGGSSMVANLLAMGVLQSIHARGAAGAVRRRPR